jgi:hypothetical protein
MEVDRRLLFDDFSLDPSTEQLSCGGEVVALTPKAFAILRRLVEDGGKVVPKGELLRAGWAKTHVSDGVLKVIILEIRRAARGRSRSAAFHRDRAAPGLPLHRPAYASGKGAGGGSASAAGRLRRSAREAERE